MVSNLTIVYRLLFVLCLWKVSMQSTSLRRTFTLYSNPNETTSWGNASKFCETEGGQLLKMDSKLKYHVLSYLDNVSPFNKSLSQETFWIGLHNKEEAVSHCGEINFFWNDCEPLSPVWTKWSAGEPNDCPTKRCAEIQNLQWKTQSCSQSRGFLCEKQQGTEECSYLGVEVQYLTGLDFTKIQNATFNANFVQCQSYCSTTLVNLHWQCWMFKAENSSLNSNPQECILYYSEEQIPVFHLQPGVNVTNGTTYYVRDCFAASLRLDYTITELETTDNIMPNTSCPVIGDCYFESISEDGFTEVTSYIHQELDINGDEQYCKEKCLELDLDGQQCWFIDLFSEISKICRLYFLRQEIDQKFWKTETAKRRSTLLVKRCLKHEDTTTQPITTTTTTLNLQQLLVDKTSTSSYRNKFISVYESTASKVVSGVVGSVFIGIIIGTIVISDLKTLGTHATTIGLRNIKRRNICCPPKKQKIKSKPHVDVVIED